MDFTGSSPGSGGCIAEVSGLRYMQMVCRFTTVSRRDCCEVANCGRTRWWSGMSCSVFGGGDDVLFFDAVVKYRL